MPNWEQSMKQTFEYYKVDPITWMDSEPISDIIDSRIEYDGGAETRGSASFTASKLLGECYIRVYMITIQNGIREKFPLGVYMVQTPTFSHDGKTTSVSMDAYTPLIELKEKQPPIGYFTHKNKNVLNEVYSIMRENMRAPIVKTESEDFVFSDFISDVQDTWLVYLNDLTTSIRYKFDLDEMGRVIFKPIQNTESLKPIWIFNDDNSSILYPALSIDNDLYGIPNVVEVIFSNNESQFYARVENREDSSPISIQNRGREIVHRVTNPEITGVPTQKKIKDYAEQQLKEMSSLEYTITYTHGYCPVRVGDAVILNYSRSGINNIKAKIISQSLSCVPGAPVEEKAVFTNNLWR